MKSRARAQKRSRNDEIPFTDNEIKAYLCFMMIRSIDPFSMSIVVILSVGVALFVGLQTLVNVIYPVFFWIMVGIAALAIVLAIFFYSIHKVRVLSAPLLLLASRLAFFSLWPFAFGESIHYAGTLWTVVGIAIFGIGVVVVAAIGMALSAAWIPFSTLAAWMALSFLLAVIASSILGDVPGRMKRWARTS